MLIINKIYENQEFLYNDSILQRVIITGKMYHSHLTVFFKYRYCNVSSKPKSIVNSNFYLFLNKFTWCEIQS